MRHKLNKILITSGLIVLIVLLIAIYNIAFATEENNENLKRINDLRNSNVSGIVYGDKVVAKYSHYGSPITNINSLITLLNKKTTDANDILATYTSLYCLQHHQALPTYKADLERITNSNVEISQYITFTYGSTPTISQSKFSDYMQHTSTESKVTKSNVQWQATECDMKTISTSYGTYTTNVFAYAAAFSEKRSGEYTKRSGNKYYGNERAQQSIWGVTGAWYGNEQETYRSVALYRAGKALDEYESEAGTHGSTPTVSVEANAGTILLGNNNSNYKYKIGPFSMDDYAYAYSSDAESFSGGLMGGLVEGKLILNNGTTIPINGSTCKIEYTTVGDNNRSGTYFTTPANYNYPWPNSTFYIVVDKSLCGNATTLSEVSFKYQSTRAEGKGWVCQSQYVYTEWKRVDIKDTPSHTYSCKVSLNGHSCSGSSTSHNNGNSRTCTADCTDSTSYCDEGWWYGHHTNICDNCNCDGKDKWVDYKCYCDEEDNCDGDHGGYWKCTHSHYYCGNTGYCSKGYYSGYHGSHSSTYQCGHGYTWCESFNWEANMSVQYGQPMLAVNYADVYVEQTEIKTTVDLRLTTDITIDKYIAKVEHTGEAITTYGENADRFGKTIAVKNTNSVKVERGDKVTFKIVLTNHQDEEAKVKIRDILPNNDGYTITPSIGDWITVSPSTPTTIVVSVIANDITGTANNTGIIITRNQGPTETASNTTNSVDYPRTTDRSGPVVNVAELNGGKLEDADYYTIKEYDVSLDKNIVKVEHSTNNIATYNDDERKNMDETVKKNNPVYVEYGDKVTYEIDIYNTCSPYTEDRKAEPYWEPDKVYVDIEDTLPNKYSELGVTVSNGTGELAIGNKKFTVKGITVPAGNKVTVTVTLVVEEHLRTKQEVNTAKLINDVKNINQYVIQNNSTKDTTSDYYHLNDYNLSIHKYISKYNDTMRATNNNNNNAAKKVTSETNNSNLVTDTTKQATEKEYYTRYTYTENQKATYPLAVEKTESLIYSIMASNDSEVVTNTTIPSATKKATQIRPTKIIDYIEEGLYIMQDSNKNYKITATIYNKEGAVKTQTVSVDISKGTKDANNYVPYTFTIDNSIILDPGDYIIYDIEVKVDKNNMYLFALKNRAEVVTLTNINDIITEDNHSRIVKDSSVDENIGQETSSEYVKLKDLVIAGRVWLDRDKDGYMGTEHSGKIKSSINVENNPSSNINYDIAADEEKAMEGIKVHLYRVGTGTNGADEKIRTVKTNSDGLYSFGYEENTKTSWRDGVYNQVRNADGTITLYESDQRIEKASGKDEYKNYIKGDSEYYKYYVEFEYDGIVYKSTEVYSGTDNLNNDGTMRKTDSQYRYRIDSNADEFDGVRNTFNNKHEIVGFDKAYNEDKSTQATLEYEKDGHNSYLKIDHTRAMKARSFLIKYSGDEIEDALDMCRYNCGAAAWKSCSNHYDDWKVLIDIGIFDETQFANTEAGRIDAQTWLGNKYDELKATGSTQETKYLWLYKEGIEYQYPETEYLKFINLGLEEREDVDINITQDVYEVKTTINGEQMTYDYNQNEYTLGNSHINKAEAADIISDKFDSPYFMTGYEYDTDLNGNGTVEGNNSKIKLYEFKIYNSDYNYRTNQYNAQAVQDYKGNGNNKEDKESELNIETTYRIRVTNNKITNDEPKLSTKDIKVYTGINEIVQYYDTDFVDFDFVKDADGKDTNVISGFNIKTKDEKGYLISTPIKVVSAKYVFKDGSTQNAVLSKTSIYNTENDAVRKITDNSGKELYSTLYIRPSANTDMKDQTKLILAEGESLDVLITFVVDKTKESADYQRFLDGTLQTVPLDEYVIILEEKTNVAEISAYSTYYKKTNGEYDSAGLVDKDSNPGNFGERYTLPADKNIDCQEYLALYEDDTFKTGIDLEIHTESDQPDNPGNPPPSDNPDTPTVERKLTGFVWNDARTETATDENGKQYLGDGRYNTDKTAKVEAKKNAYVSNGEEKDIAIQGVTAKLVEMISIPQGNNKEKIYEETIYVNGDKSVMETTTSSDGKYTLKGYIPGEYIVKFYYGNKQTDNMKIYNGQDYKSTAYQVRNGDDKSYAEHQRTTDDILKVLEESEISDAKDDEIRRLETISYSETMNNNLNRILRGKNTSNAEELINKTNMESETAEFLVRAEKEAKYKPDGTIKPAVLSFTQTMEKFNTITRHPIRNIDFGIEYRPELQVGLTKYITNVKVKTSDATGNVIAEPLVDARFNEYYGIVVKTDYATGETEFLCDTDFNIIKVSKDATNADIETAIANAMQEANPGVDVQDEINEAKANCQKTIAGNYVITIAGVELDKNNSIGLENVTFVENSYNRNLDGTLFKYENIVQDKYRVISAEQGVVYLAIDDEIMQGATVEIEYLFAGHNLSEIDRIGNNLSKLRFKNNNAATSEDMKIYASEPYSGSMTARNELNAEYYGYDTNLQNQTIAYRKKDKDVEVEMKDSTKVTIDASTAYQKYYGRYLGSTYYTGNIGDSDVVAEVKIDQILDYIDNDLVFEAKKNNGSNNLWKTTTTQELLDSKLIAEDVASDLETAGGQAGKYILDNQERAFDTRETITDTNTGNVTDVITRSNLALSLSDRTKDAEEYAEGTDPTLNKNISNFLSPRDSSALDSFGTVRLIASRVIASEEDTNDMSYINVGEIVQYTSETGRVTTLTTTLGNAKFIDSPNKPLEEWDVARIESDTAATEKVTFSPPTGLGKVEKVVRDVVEGASYTVVVIITVAVVCVMILGIVRLYRKRRIK